MEDKQKEATQGDKSTQNIAFSDPMMMMIPDNSLRFLDMLGGQDFTTTTSSSSIFDDFLQNISGPTFIPPEYSEVVDTPATPNSSSMSSSSTDQAPPAPNDHDQKIMNDTDTAAAADEDEDEDEQDQGKKTKKQ